MSGNDFEDANFAEDLVHLAEVCTKLVRQEAEILYKYWVKELDHIHENQSLSELRRNLRELRTAATKKTMDFVIETLENYMENYIRLQTSPSDTSDTDAQCS